MDEDNSTHSIVICVKQLLHLAASVPKKSDLKKPRIGIVTFDILPLIRGELEFDLQVPVHMSSQTASVTDAPKADQPVVFSESVISLPTEPVENHGKVWMFTDDLVSGEATIPGSEGRSAETKYTDEDGELQEDNDIEHRMKENISSSPLLPIEVLRLPNPKVKKENDYAITFHGVAFVDLFQLLQPGEQKIRGAYLVHPFDDAEYTQKMDCVSTLAREAAMMHRVREAAAAARPSLRVSSAASTAPTARQMTAKKTLQTAVESSFTSRDSFLKSQLGSLSRTHLQLSESTPSTITPGAEFGPCRTFIVIELVLDKPLIPKRVIKDLATDLKPLISKKEKLPDRAQSAEKAVKEYHKTIIEVSQNLMNNMKMQDIQCLLNESSMFAELKEQLKFPIVNLVREKFFRSTPFAAPEEFQKFLSDLFVYLVREMRQSMMVAFSPARKIDTRVDPKASHGTIAELLVYAEEAEYTGELNWARHYFQKRVAMEPLNADAWIDLAVFCLRHANTEEAEECLRECLSVQDSNVKALIIMGALSASRGFLEDACALFETATTYDENNSQAWIIYGLFYESIADERRAEYCFSKARRIEASRLDLGKPKALEHQVEDQVLLQKEGIRSESHTTVQTVEASPKQISPPSYKGSPFLQIAELFLDAHLTTYAERAMAHHLIYMRKYLDRCSSYYLFSLPETSLRDAPSVEEGGSGLKFLALPKQVPRSSPSALAYMNELAQYHVVTAKVVMRKELGNVIISDHDREDNYIEAITRARESLMTAIEIDPENVEACATLGELYSMVGDRASAIKYFGCAMDLRNWPCRNSRIFQLRFAELCLEEGQFEKSKLLFLQCCHDAPSCLSWLGVGISCYRLNQLEDAEEALEEANALNNKNATVWAYLSMICIEKRRVVEAEQSYKYTIKMGLNDKVLLDELHGLQKKAGLGNPLQT